MAAEKDAVNYGRVKLVVSDLDGTLYPGHYEEEPLAEKRGLFRNVEQIKRLEKLGVPVLAATGNSLQMAQRKFEDPRDPKRLLWDLSSCPGIYCNGAHVKGAGGRNIEVKSVGNFLARFIDAWNSDKKPPPSLSDVCITGLGLDGCLFMRNPGLGEKGEKTSRDFLQCMMIQEGEYQYLSPEDFGKQQDTILSLLMLFPDGAGQEELLAMQQWLHEAKLLLFGDPAGKLSNGDSGGDENRVVCKHVHVPGIGPEIDISPDGVNKGSAMATILRDTKGNLGIDVDRGTEIAVMGDAGNDVELFGMKRDQAGTTLLPLGLDFRPELRVAMPWANDSLLLADANVRCKANEALDKIASAKESA